MNLQGLEKLTTDLRDWSHDAAFGTLPAGTLPAHDFTIYDSLSYIVVRGDALSLIAQKFGTTTHQLMLANPAITNPDKIRVGQVIQIPPRPMTILNQLDLDFCTAFATSELQKAIWGTDFDPFYQFAKIKQVRGEYTSYGANLRDAANAVIKYGSLPIQYAPYTHDIGNKNDESRDFLANWKNYPDTLDIFAKKDADVGYFTIDGAYDVFDNIRSAMQIHIQERRAISFGLFWHDEWTEAPGGIIPDIMPNDSQGGGHNIAIIGQKTINGELYLVLQQSWGDTAGDHGLYYFPRNIIDLSAREGYGAYMFSRLQKSTASVGFGGWIANLLNSLLTYVK